jgi:hypothetical protein
MLTSKCKRPIETFKTQIIKVVAGRSKVVAIWPDNPLGQEVDQTWGSQLLTWQIHQRMRSITVQQGIIQQSLLDNNIQ